MVLGKRAPEDTMSKVKVNIKWGKEAFNDVEADLSDSPLVFKSQLFALTGVPPERQKVMIKGGLLKDDDWGKQVPKEGMTIMVMGTADAIPVEAPKNAPVFVEDLPEAEQANMETKKYGAGLQNLGNTCYMNSTVQCLFGVQPLRSALQEFKAAPAGPSDMSTKLVASTRDLFKELEKGGAPLTPYSFLMNLRTKYPQFAQQGNQGVFMQQDAEECWTNVLYTLREKIKAEGGEATIDKLFGIETKLQLTCEESGETMEETATNFMLKCNITAETSHLHQGIGLGLQDDREKRSEVLGRSVQFKGASRVTRLPPYLTVQMVRFFFKTQNQEKAKILKKVSYPLELDVYDFCTDSLKAQLDPARARLKEIRDKEVEDKKLAKGKGAVAAAPAAPTGDVDMAEASGPSTSGSTAPAGALTGKFELISCLTHKGRSADSGHYTAWVKQTDGRWVLFDDDTLHFKTDEDILALCGGGDWHMAYLLLYRAITVPLGEEGTAAATAPAATAEAAAPMQS